MTTQERAALVALYEARKDDDSSAACDECEDCGPVAACRYHSLLGELRDALSAEPAKAIPCREFGLCAMDPSRGLGNFCEQCPAVK